MMRRRLLQIPLTEDLYPIGTDIVRKYIREGPNPFVKGTFSAGEAVIDESYSTYISITYIPIDMNYTYQKNGERIMICCYDENYNYLNYVNYNNLNEQTLTGWDANTKYIRIKAGNPHSRDYCAITRIV